MASESGQGGYITHDPLSGCYGAFGGFPFYSLLIVHCSSFLLAAEIGDSGSPHRLLFALLKCDDDPTSDDAENTRPAEPVGEWIIQQQADEH